MPYDLGPPAPSFEMPYLISGGSRSRRAGAPVTDAAESRRNAEKRFRTISGPVPLGEDGIYGRMTWAVGDLGNSRFDGRTTYAGVGTLAWKMARRPIVSRD